MSKEKLLYILKNIATVIVIIAMFIIIFYQNRDRDIFKFGQNESSKIISSTQSNAEGFSDGDIKRIGDKVAVLTTKTYSILDKDAKGQSVKVALSEPRIHTEGEYAACYTLDSTEVIVFKNEIEAYRIKTDNKILTVKVNKNGYLFVVTEKEGYNCESMVFNRAGEAIFKWDVSKSEFLDGDINCSNNAIALSLAAAGNNKLVGEVVLIDITDAEIIKKETFDSSVFFSLDFNNNDTYVTLGNDMLTYFNSDGTKKWSYKFGKRTLSKADISNHDMMVLAFSATGGVINGNSTDVKVINRLGKVTSQKKYNGVIDDISLSNTSIALVFDKEIFVVNSNLKEKKMLKTDYSIKKVALYDDNEHLFVLGKSSGEILK